MNFGSKKGYKTYKTRTGRTKYVHTRVMEKKLGGPITGGRVVHHINGDKSDNRPENLVAVSRGVHGRLHGRYPNACYKCGRSSHRAADCYARTDYARRPLKRRR